MTINKLPNQDDVEYRSGLLGWQESLVRQLPKDVSSATTGGGSVLPNETGTMVNPGASSGDVAQLLGWYAYAHGNAVKKATIDITYSLQDTTALTNDVEIGWLSTSVNNNVGMYLDLTAGEYNVSGTTATASTPSLRRNFTHLTIEADYNAGETVFAQAGEVNEEKTVAAVPSGAGGFREGLLLTNSNGASEDVRVSWARQMVEF